MTNFFKIFFQKNVFLKTFLFIGIIQITFFLITYDNHFFSDDYQHLIGLKLYNLIQGSSLSFENLFEFYSNHFLPFYLFYHQFMPDNYIYYHGIVALIFFLNSLLIFKIAFTLTNSQTISFLSAFLYSINMSIHIKSYVWNIFHFSIVNSFTGLLSIIFFIMYYQATNYKKYLWLFVYIVLGTLSSLNFENGLLYPIIASTISFLFLKNKSLVKSSIGLLPIVIFFILLIFSGKDPLYLAKERLADSYNERLTNKLEINPNSYSYFYRSQYAERDIVGYSFRIYDNLSSSLNLYTLENSIKYFINTDNLKNYIINNYLKLIVLLFILLLLLIVNFVKNLKQIQFKFPVIKFLLLYFVTFFIYTFIFFRQDINSALAFSSSILISIMVIEFYRNKLFFLPSLVMILFVGSTLLYSATGFEIVKYSATRSVIKKTSNIHYEYALQKINDPNIQYYQDYKFLYYYLNFQENKEYLKKYKNLKYSDFVSAMSNDKLKN
mgnify:CR=1 FL=1